MGDAEEKAQEASLELYKAQLSQVTQAIQATHESEDLKQLKDDLEELIKLTEDNLLEIKKAELLKSLETDVNTDDDVKTPINSSRKEEDEEYAAFKEAIGESVERPSPTTNHQASSSVTATSGGYAEPRSFQERETTNSTYTYRSDDGDDDDDDNLETAKGNLMELIGKKCRAPFCQDWGHLHYCNAMIWSVDPPSSEDEISDHKVHVIFINPTHRSMIPCPYFMDGACRFSDDACRFSHGYPVKVCDLQAYVEPDHSKIVEGCRCLAKSVDGVWYQATVQEVCSDHQVQVHFDASKESRPVMVEHIVPLDHDDSDSESSSSDDTEDEERPSASGGVNKISNDSDEESEVPVYLWKPSKTTDRLGAWETHTRGIGSKLMAKMGYITGQGLGRYGDGRAEPVPILLLPQGKSLDKIMQLKEMSGDADLFNAMKTMEKRQKAQEKRQADKEKRRETRENSGVFGFLNNELAGQRDHPHVHSKHHSHSHSRHAGRPSTSSCDQEVKVTSEKELTARSDQEVNEQIFKTAEEMRAVERRLSHLRQQLSRNESKDRKMADSVRQKMAEQESYLHQLKTSSRTLESHQTRRKAHKKLTIF